VNEVVQATEQHVEVEREDRSLLQIPIEHAALVTTALPLLCTTVFFLGILLSWSVP
jgi:hypothetical protein